MSNVNVGVVNPAYVTHQKIAVSRRISIEGIFPSEMGMVIAMIEYRTGQVGMMVDGVDMSNEQSSFQSMIRAHQLLLGMANEMDRRLAKHAMTVPGER